MTIKRLNHQDFTQAPSGVPIVRVFEYDLNTLEAKVACYEAALDEAVAALRHYSKPGMHSHELAVVVLARAEAAQHPEATA